MEKCSLAKEWDLPLALFNPWAFPGLPPFESLLFSIEEFGSRIITEKSPFDVGYQYPSPANQGFSHHTEPSPLAPLVEFSPHPKSTIRAPSLGSGLAPQEGHLSPASADPLDPQIKVMHKQLLLFHNAVSAYFAGNQKQLEQTLQQFNIKLRPPGAEKPSWLEEQ